MKTWRPGPLLGLVLLLLTAIGDVKVAFLRMHVLEHNGFASDAVGRGWKLPQCVRFIPT